MGLSWKFWMGTEFCKKCTRCSRQGCERGGTFALAGGRGWGTIAGTMDRLPTGCAGFSNHWKNFFQSLENRGIFFPIVGKFCRFFQPLEKKFPTIGKKVSNRWKTCGRHEKGRTVCPAGRWLPDQDLNLNKQIQSLLCYRYTIGQATRTTLRFCGGLSRGFGL